MAFGNIYNGKRVLVIGHTGFKGAWLSAWLLQLGADVHGIALPPKSPQDLFVTTGLEQKLHHHICDIKNKTALIDLIKTIAPQFVFHLAAQALVKPSYDDPVDTYATNLMGTVHVLEALRHTPSVKAAVIITSDKCYKNVEWEWGYRETDELGGLDPYGASKACAEIAIQSYRASFFNTPNSPRIASTRAGNVIGGGDWSEKRIVPDIIRSLIARKPILLRSPNATRPWQFVLEPLSGYLHLGAQMTTQQNLTSGWNFGPETINIVNVHRLTETMIQCWGNGTIEEELDQDNTQNNPNRFHEATLLSLDISKAKHQLQWQPTLDLHETVSFTIEWYRHFVNNKNNKENKENNNMLDFSLQQITQYTQKAQEKDIPWATK